MTLNNDTPILAPFTESQANYIKNSANCWLNVLEGGKRGGKNVTNVMAWCAALEYHENKLHLAAGVSVATTKLNIIDCDGFGLLWYFYGRYREGKYKDRDCVYIKTKLGEKIVLISGGGKDGNEKLIKGNTYGTAILTEVNECHINFIREVSDRTLSSTDRKLFYDFNPKQPTHWFYKDVLEFHERQQRQDKTYGLNYAHLTIADNYSIGDDKLREILKSYDKSTVWYRRDIKGERAAAEGLIFPQFANNPDRWLFDKPANDYLKLYIGVDFGGSKAKTVFVLSGIRNGANGPEIHILDAHAIKDSGLGVDADQIAGEYKAFLAKTVQRYGKAPEMTFTDHLDFLRLQMYKAVDKQQRVVFADKSIALAEWCQLLNALFNLDMLKISKDCGLVIEMFKGLLYDEKADDDRPLDDNTTCDVDTYDAMRYSICKVMREWVRRGLIYGGNRN